MLGQTSFLGARPRQRCGPQSLRDGPGAVSAGRFKEYRHAISRRASAGWSVTMRPLLVGCVCFRDGRRRLRGRKMAMMKSASALRMDCGVAFGLSRRRKGLGRTTRRLPLEKRGSQKSSHSDRRFLPSEVFIDSDAGETRPHPKAAEVGWKRQQRK